MPQVLKNEQGKSRAAKQRGMGLCRNRNENKDTVAEETYGGWRTENGRGNDIYRFPAENSFPGLLIQCFKFKIDYLLTPPKLFWH